MNEIPSKNDPADSLRRERDSLGELEISATAYFGIHTERARSNFPLSGHPIAEQGELIEALAAIKQAAALANAELGVIETAEAEAIVTACAEIRGGSFRDQFVVDVFQGGAGTSTNMNMNEVIANRALEHLGCGRGEYGACHPLDTVNRSQSTNDVYPSAIRIAILAKSQGLRAALDSLADGFIRTGERAGDAKKLARTQLRDAVPMRIADEWIAWGEALRVAIAGLAHADRLLLDLNLGGTAVGTGLNAAPGYSEACIHHLRRLTGLPLRTAPNLIAATQNVSVLSSSSSSLSICAQTLGKICNDLRLLSSGPETGIGELALPALQAGSSMMPGKVNPVIPEAVNQACFRVVSNDLLVSQAAAAGQLQLNAFLPAMAHGIFDSQTLLTRAADILRTRCIAGVAIDLERSAAYAKSSSGVATERLPDLGYEAAAEMARASQLGATTPAS